MRCSLDISKSIYQSLGKIRANPVMYVHTGKVKCALESKIRASLSLDTSLGNSRYKAAILPSFNQIFSSIFGNTLSTISANKNDGKITGQSNIRSLSTLKYQPSDNSPFQQVASESEIEFINNNPDIRVIKTSNFEFVTLSLKSTLRGVVDTKANLAIENLGLKSRVTGQGKFLVSKKTEKIIGSKNNNLFATHKLYPIKDISVSGLINHRLEKNNLYSHIDGGVITGDYLTPYGKTEIVSDDDNSYIQLYNQSGINLFHLAFEVSPPQITPEHTLLVIRAAAPTQTRETDISPSYSLTNIKLQDPSGNLIIKYKDFVIIGDANYRQLDVKNYSTYLIEPEINIANKYTWNKEYPILGLSSGYVLSMDIFATCESKSFNSAFNFAYQNKCSTEENKESGDNYLALSSSPISTQYQEFEINPDNSLRISDIEIACSGTSFGIRKDNYLNFYTEVSPTGQRLQRSIYPVEVLAYDTQDQTNPITNSVWRSSPDINNNVYYNTSENGRLVVTDRITNYSKFGYITLESPSQSGKLNLRFSHQPPIYFLSERGGSFNFGRRDSAFSKSELAFTRGHDTIFNIDEIYLKIRARKENSSVPNFPIDVVGWSKDYVLNNTSTVGAFLQNSDTSLNSSLLSSGLLKTNHLSISSESISSKDQYSEFYALNDGGDHSIISTGTIVDSTIFKEYIVPLKIYNINNKLGLPTNYQHSTFFENLFLDIYPLPSGASIARAELVIKYGPCNAIPLSVVGYDEEDLSLKEFVLFPDKNTPGHKPLNIYRQGGRLSDLDNIPHGFNSPHNLKTNYSRRWRGSDGVFKRSAFSDFEFDFSFEKLQQNYPFTKGYYDFNNYDENDIIYSNIQECSGIFVGNLNNSIYKNLGWRLNNQSLFNNRNIKSIDWSYPGHPLYGKIFDAFDSAIRTSGENGYFKINKFDISNGFALHLRFSPDITISGQNYNLFNSGIIASKWDLNNSLELALGYKDGYLTAYARDINNNVVTISDTLTYDNYQYPLSILLTYNDNNSRKLKLYTNKELDDSNFTRLRNSSQPFNIINSDSDFTFGYSMGSGVGYNGFICGLGLSHNTSSSGTNLVEKNPDKKLLQSDVESFFDSHHSLILNENNFNTSDNFGMWKFINNDTSKWQLGEFKYCQFGPDFKIMSNRNGENFVFHNFISNGDTYDNLTNLSINNVNISGVAYHTQIENDALRISLSDNDGRFYSSARRISKSLPRGYDFEKNAIYVETILQHETSNIITWPDGKLGPRLIVSLYTTSKESNTFDTQNIGLINRKIHYISTDECWTKIKSSFDIYDLMDEKTEPWSNFRKETIISEFNHKYFSNDLNKMFLQYDLVYPSGHFDSYIKIHSVNVRLEDALCKPKSFYNMIPVYTSGDAVAQKSLPLLLTNVFGSLNNKDNSLSLFASGYFAPVSSGRLNLYSSGVFYIDGNMSLHSSAYRSTKPIQRFGQTFGASIYDQYSVPLVVVGRNTFSEESMSLYAQTDSIPQITDTLVLFTQFPYYTDNYAITLHTVAAPSPPLLLQSSGYTNLTIIAPPVPDSFISSGSMSLFTNNSFENIVNIYIDVSSNFNLSTLNFSDILSLSDGAESFRWDKDNIGLDIVIDDNSYASIPLEDNIRGVETICYGDCENSYGCIQTEVNTHETKWLDSYCVDGGVARAFSTYTNQNVGYNNNYYGIRKFNGLIPNSPYNIIISAITGTSGILEGPRQLFEWEYGTVDDVDYSGVKIYQNSDYRQSGNLFGHDVAISNNLMAVGAPGQDLYEHDGFLCKNAGSIFVYRREPEPSGYDWKDQGHKSGWNLEKVLTLPSGFIRDYYIDINRKFAGYDVPQRYWYIGQAGRELGYSLDIAKTDKREIIVAGAPGALWDRQFEQLQMEDVNICLMLFTDEFNANLSINSVLNALETENIIFKYFANPATRFNIHIIILEPVIGTSIRSSSPVPNSISNYVSKYRINRHFTFDKTTQAYKDKNQLIFNDIKNAFHSVYPYDTNKPRNNIPVMLGVSVDTSSSLGYKPIQSALDDFIQYYKEYSFNSGIVDYNTGDKKSGYVYNFGSPSEKWTNQAVDILNEILDTGKLISSEAYSLFTTNLGAFNTSLSEFNTTPPSGTSVYIFEKPSGLDWELVQEIKSPNIEEKRNVPPDRFGHDVAISDDGKIIVVGSPYIPESVRVYQRKNDDDIQSSLYSAFTSWLFSEGPKNVGGHAYNIWQQFGSVPWQTLYSQLNDSGKFDLRQKYNVSYYDLIYQYGTSNIVSHPTFTWKFLYEKFLPNSRLGYSVDVNEDGSLVIAGAPTDSLGSYDTFNNWWLPDFEYIDSETNWKNNVNAGAVRIFESRNYYPHNRVVEYGIFGNKHRAISSLDDDIYFNLFDSSFNRPFVRTPFSETDIPQDAGVLFIITPEINALNDEIIENIKQWLALGDRNLVLVGDDPYWEENGAYRKSNQIINDLLSRLDSRMRLHSAKNQKESLSSFDRPGNISASFVPKETISTHISNVSLNGSGVGDIRLYWPELDFRPYRYYCSDENYLSTNNRCSLPIQNNGDLRAQWMDVRGPSPGQQPFKPFPDAVNLAQYFQSSSWGLQLWAYETPGGNLRDKPPTYQFEPRPILAASFRSPDRTIEVPPTPSYTRIEYKLYSRLTGSENNYEYYTNLASSPLPSSESVLLWSSSSGNYLSLDTNITNSINDSRFFDPPQYNDTDALLMAKAETFEKNIFTPKLIYDKHYYAALENIPNTTSEAILIAGQFTENYDLLFGGSDINLNFYRNIVAFNKDGGARIAQISGFTKQQSFASVFKTSAIKPNMEIFGNEVYENISVETLKQSADTYNVAWIANPKEMPSDEDIYNLIEWVKYGNKKIIITYGPDSPDSETVQPSSNINYANIVTYICNKLGISMKPLFLKGKNAYPTIKQESIWGINRHIYENFSGLGISTYAPMILGFDQPNSIITNSINVFYSLQGPGGFYDIIPIDLQKATALAFFQPPVYDDHYTEIGLYRLRTGIAKVTFPVIPGSGYRLFFDCNAESAYETKPLSFYITKAQTDVLNDLPTRQIKLQDFNPDDTLNTDIYLNNFTWSLQSNVFNYDGKITTQYIDLYVPTSNSGSIDIFIDGTDVRSNNQSINPDTIRTHRLVSISGCFLPIESGVITNTTPTYEYWYEPNIIEMPGSPGYSYTIPGQFGPITHSHSLYCGCEFPGDPQIQDGPVVVAQEIYHQGGFSNGKNKSRITLISDASIIQGKIANYDANSTRNTRLFLNSLYPPATFNNQNSSRQYENIYKIVSPERMSPQKLVNFTNNSGILTKFKGDITTYSNIKLNSYSSNDYKLNPYFKSPMLDPPKGEPDKYIDLRPDGEIREEPARSETYLQPIQSFIAYQQMNNAYCKFSGVYNGKMYEDSSITGSVSNFMKDTGYDYIDPYMLINYSGYPGDLFGYSVKLKNGKIYIGCPFAPFYSENITNWDDVISNTFPNSPASGIDIGFNGGAGAVFVFEKSDVANPDYYIRNPWECIRKIRPSTISAGNESNNSDMFGFKLDVDGDMVVIGAPCHSYDSLFIKNINSGQFVTKSFNEEFNIAKTKNIDLGSNENRIIYGSGIISKHNGAVFTYENKIVNWSDKELSIVPIQKIVPQGFNAREKNSLFGYSVAIDRAKRKDSDYSLVVGSPYHTSGINNNQGSITNAGSAYSFDAMLRRPTPSFAHPDTFIAGNLIGKSGENYYPKIPFKIKNNNEYNQRYLTYGKLFSNENGEIFIEVSGQDKITNGFMQHRPYIEYVRGSYDFGKQINGYSPLFIEGKMIETSGNMPLFAKYHDSLKVYNNMTLYVDSVMGTGSGNILLYNSGSMPDYIKFDTLNMSVSGKNLPAQNSITLHSRGMF